MKTKSPPSGPAPKAQVAVVGIGGLFPGTPGLEGFWADIAARRSASHEVPAGRWLIPPDQAYDPAVGAPDKVYSKRGCTIDDFALDAEGLQLDAALVAGLDRVFHFALHAGRMAWRDAAEDEALDLRRVGVILGNIALPTDSFSAFSRSVLTPALAKRLPSWTPPPFPRVAPLNRFAAGLPASILARALGLSGGSYTLDAACASSLYALKLAVDELLEGRADAMLAGGLSRPDCLYTQMGFSQLRALSASGRCAPFDEGGDGLVVGEGAGIFLLKRLADAERAGDKVYAVIRGIGLSNDIDGSLLAPEGGGQLRAMRAAYKEAGWSPSDADLVECHATGTPVGDAAELRSLQALWGDAGWRAGQCAIGSVKSNVGHLLTGAGAAGLMKVLLGLRHQTLPPSANFDKPSPRLSLGGTPFRVQTEAAPWRPRADGVTRKAAVSSFGFGGINAHVLIEEHAPKPRRSKARAPSAQAAPAAAPADAAPPADALRPAGDAPGRPCAVEAGGRAPRPLSGTASAAGGPVAIVGMEARFGSLGRLRSFQESVLGGKPAGESGTRLVPDLQAATSAFRIPPIELAEMLPQQVLMLQVADAALRDARALDRDHERTGVFVGMELDVHTADFHVRWSLPEEHRDQAGPPLSANRTVGALGGIIASRIAREFRIGGPSFTVASEETSGLRALEAAARALQRGELDMALAGAVDLCADERSRSAFEALRPCSPGGRARPFDRDADGAVLGEGAAAVVLKRLDDALRDGDRIYGTVRGIGAARDYGAALERAYEDAGIKPSCVSYLEGHGSGVPAEDAAEAEALAKFFGAAKKPSLALGSVKEVAGHAGAAAGMASLVKAALALYPEILPPLGLREARDEFRQAGERFHAPRLPQYWHRNRSDGPRRAGVSAMGLGGDCVHVVLEAHDSQIDPSTARLERSQPLGARDEGLFPVEDDTPPALVAGIAQLKEWLSQQPAERGIEALAREWFAARPPGSKRRRLGVAFVARHRSELAEQLALAERSLIQDPAAPVQGMDRVFYAPEPTGSKGKVAFVFPGSGNQYIGMGTGVAAQWPEVLRRQDAENDRLQDQFLPELFAPWRRSWPEGWEVLALDKLSRDHRGMIFGQVAHGAVLSDLVRSLGVEPEGVVGYSLGETAGLFALRAWKDRDEMLRRMERSSLFVSDLAGRCDAARKTWGLAAHEAVDWALGVIDRPENLVRTAVDKMEQVFLLIVNTPKECVIGGARHAVGKLVSGLGGTFLPLDGVTTVHCKVAREVEEAYLELHKLPTSAPGRVRFYSGAWGRSYPLDSDSAAQAVTAQAVAGIDFPGLIERAYADGYRVFLEMGPRNTCSRMIARILGDRPHVARSSCVRDQDDVSSVLRLLGAMIAERIPVDLDALYGFETRVVGHSDPAPAPKSAIVVPIHRGLPPQPSPRPPQQQPKPPRPSASDGDQPAPAPRPAPPAARPAVPAIRHPAAAPAQPAPAPSHPVLAGIAAAQAATLKAHAAFLRLSEQNAQARLGILGLLASGVSDASVPLRSVFLDRPACLRFAVGKIGEVLGAAFASIDAHPTRVRLPDEPLMLVDRILSVTGEPLSLTSGSVVTEHDVKPGAWYLDGGRIPTCIAVEAGQADLFLSGYLGIDLKTEGLAMYRLLDAAVTFHRGLPAPGEVIRYDIKILRFARQGGAAIFFFEFEGAVGGQPLLSMKKGCAGFFTPRQLEEGKGIVFTALDRKPLPGRRPADWADLAPMKRESYDDKAVDALRAGDLAGAFGADFAGLPLAEPLRLPGGQSSRMRLIDRVLDLDPEGGRYGLGVVTAEADIHPDDWFLTCHFVDDQVMPGTLMYECCLHTLRVFLLRMGWVGEASRCWYEPVPGVESKLKCRGQVLPTTKKATYEISIKELGYGPAPLAEPYAIADALMYSDGKPVVLITDMSVRIAGLARDAVEGLWRGRRASRSAAPAERPEDKKALFGPERILAFAVGKPSDAFGERYKVFDGERVIARLPGPPYQFLDRITGIRDCRPWELEAGARIEAEYDVPPDAWYFRANRQAAMPFAVLLEVALQPCGWLGAYLGSALRSPTDLSFRNLGGKAVVHEDVLPDAGTLTSDIKLTRVSQSVGMIIQHYDMTVRRGGRVVYEGTTYFGFFSKAALSDQKGILGVTPHAQAPVGGRPLPVEDLAPLFPEDQSAAARPGLPLPGRALRMFDAVDLFVPEGGPHGLGFIRGVKRVDPSEWFFKAHFHQDPVCPGSLGLESFLQLLKLAARERWRAPEGARFTAMALGRPHEWVYRGQVIPANKLVTVEAVITRSDDAARLIVADGFLRVDGLLIYQMKDFSLGMA
ncbi:MAG: type I polyketide synthase [Elusimicrobia bacterium]|nr:type I polyketide synthase [Elusimicrobiota bacterium]